MIRNYNGLTAGAIMHLNNWRKKMAEMVMYPVDSSNVQEFGYDADDRILAVRFLAKGNSPSSLYHYYDVEPETFEEFMAAPSMGKFIWTNMRDRYEYAKVE